MIVAGATPSCAAGQPVTLGKADRAAAIDAIVRGITANYVFADLRAPLVARLRTAAKRHRYDTADPAEFAERVTADLATVSRDGHLYLRNDPARYAAALAPPTSDTGLAAFARTQAIREHHGLTEQAILPGNIRYLKITGFKWVPDGSTARAYDQAATFLADGDAIILDLRGNGGGESDAADTCLDIIVRRLGGTRPFYILVDGLVGSAAEAVAYSAKLEKRAIIVGTRTFGAANNNRLLPIAPSFILSVSYNRPIHPISGTNWEGVGVTPDLVSEPRLASEVAQQAALKRLAAAPGVPFDRLAQYRWRSSLLNARIDPPVVTDAALRGHAGRYGPIEIRYAEGRLKLYREDRPRWPQGAILTPLTGDGRFALEGVDVLRARLFGNTLEIYRPDSGQPDVFKRQVTIMQAESSS
jgi:hypothetical protein